MHTFGNRRDIDGMRALAVIPVVLFHFGFSAFSGGFVGVDVFFVISGFLITGILLRDIDAGRFNLVEFWVRRARRILPALSVMVVATLALGYLLLAPKDLAELGRTLRYQAIFISNVLFMHEDGYFQPKSDLKPLLHTWSLAVEEQYYIFFPLLLLALTRYVRHWRWMLLAILLISFGLNIHHVQHKPDVAFFSLPTRAWELLCGAMLAALPAPRQAPPRWLLQLVGSAGLGAVLLAMFAFSSATVFPGWAALLPVLGTVGLLWSGAYGSTWVSRLLGLRPLVWIGLLSYSLYLWHWPIYVYANAVSIGGIHTQEAIGWIALSVAIAWMSLHFVEQPFREKRLLATRRSMLLGAFATIALLVISGSVVRSSGGFPQRLEGKAHEYAQAREWHAGQEDCLLASGSHKPDNACLLGGSPGIAATRMVWGDSHAAALFPAIKRGASHGGGGVWMYAMSACPPLVSDDPREGCKAFNKHTMEQFHRLGIQDVVLAANWSLYVYGRNDGDKKVLLNEHDDPAQAEQRMAIALKAQVARLREAGARVWLVDDVPLQPKGAVERLVSLARIGRSAEGLGLPLEAHLARERYMRELFQSISAADPGVHVIDPAPLLCSDTLCSIEADGHALYRDEDHLSDLGGARLAPLFTPLLLGANHE